MRTRNWLRVVEEGVRSRGHLGSLLASSTALLLCAAFPALVLAQTAPDPASEMPQPARTSAAGDSPVNIESRKPAQPEAKPDSRSVDIRVNRTLVLINVTVTDPLNRFVTGLEKEHFRLFEDKVEQEITHFSAEDAPISIGLVFDTSGSMGPKLQKSRLAAAEFFKTANPADEFFLVQFNDRPELNVPFTTDTDKIQSTLTFTQSRGRTALLDSVYLAMHEMKKAHNPRKAILIISDGGDNSSRYTETEIKNAVREADVQIFAIGIFESMANRGRTPEEAAGPGLLNELAEQTGGREYAVENIAELPDIAAKIGIELRNEYILGYTPKNRERDGKYRRVQVKLVQPRGLPPLRAYFRLGYYAPTQ
ncbi:MAG: VWA domain-containing protein [Acidobacteriaceae bacterium]|nr:VWA domain-containing protein [Acidobacteriaceae bacterium]